MKLDQRHVAMGAAVVLLVLMAPLVEAGSVSPVDRTLLGAKLRQAVAVSDLDGDGMPEVVVADFLSDSISIWRRDDEGFRAIDRLPAEGGPRALAVADLSGDGIPDLAVASFLSGEVCILVGHADGSFAESSRVRSSPGLSALITEDLDADGVEDLVLANVLTGEITFLRGAGGGDFAAPLALGNVRGASLLLATDLDADGTLELTAVGSKGKAKAFALRNGHLSAAGEVELTAALAAAGRQARAADDRPTQERSVRRVSGDGQIAPAGQQLPEALVAELREGSATPLEGETLFFWGLAGGWQALGPAAFTDDQGRAEAPVRLAPLPQNSLVLASALGATPAFFAGTGVLPVDELFHRLKTALGSAGLPGGAHAGALVSVAERLLRARETEAALTELSHAARHMERAGVPPAEPSLDLLKRLINQLLLTDAEFRAQSSAPLPCDTPVTGSIDTPTEVDSYTFSGSAGEIVSITVSEGTLPAVEWRLVDGMGQPVPGCGTFTNANWRDCTLAGGSYAVEVRDVGQNGTGTYHVHLQRLTAANRCSPSPLICDKPAGNNSTTSRARIENPADTDLFAFSGSAGEIVSITISEGTLPVAEWRLVDGMGKPVPGCGTFTNANWRDCTLLTSGSYAVEVRDLLQNDTGSYSVHLQRLTAATRCSPTSLVCDTPVGNNNIENPADTDLFTFRGSAGEIVGITEAAGSLSVPEWRLLDNAGQPVPGCGFNTIRSRDCALLTSGSYAVEVRDSGQNDTGTYHVHLQRLTAGFTCGPPLTCGTPVAGDVENPADTDLFTFNAADGALLSIDIGPGSLSFTAWRIVDPAGATICGRSTSDGTCTVGPAGPYAIEISDNNFDSTGTFTIEVDDCGTFALDLLGAAPTDPPAR